MDRYGRFTWSGGFTWNIDGAWPRVGLRWASGRALPGDARALAPTWSRAGESVAAAGLIRRTYSASECSLVRLLRWRACGPLVRMPSGEAWPGVAAVGPRASRRQFGARDGAPRHGSVVDSGLCGGQARHRCVALRFGVAVSRSRRLLGRRHHCGPAFVPTIGGGVGHASRCPSTRGVVFRGGSALRPRAARPPAWPGGRDCSARHRLLLDRGGAQGSGDVCGAGCCGSGCGGTGPPRGRGWAAGIGWRCGIEWGCGSGLGWPGQCRTWRCRTPGCRTPVPPSRGALSPGLSSRVELNRGALKRGSLNPRASEPGAAGTRALNRGAPNLRHRGRRQRGRRCHARTPATPNLSARNAGDAEPGDVEPREAGPACVWTGPAGQDGSWWERASAPRQKPSRAPERGPVRSTGTRLRALVFHVEHRADGRVPTDAPPTARDAQPSPPRCRLCGTSVTARTRLRPTRPVLGRRPSGAEPVVVRI